MKRARLFTLAALALAGFGALVWRYTTIADRQEARWAARLARARDNAGAHT